jgi:hypothetical protein
VKSRVVSHLHRANTVPARDWPSLLVTHRGETV